MSQIRHAEKMARTRANHTGVRRAAIAHWMARTAAHTTAFGVALTLAGCARVAPMSMFAPASHIAARVSEFTWVVIIISAIVYLAVLIGIWMASARGRHRDPTSVDLTKHGSSGVVLAGAVIPGIILIGLFVAGLGAMRLFPERAEHAQHFTVVGHQWWWEIRYDGPDLPAQFATANEIHIPVGQPIRIRLISSDVIHSFWVPRLQGKLDLVPGDTNEIRLLATQPGIYRGQCAEFCGLQHAHMAFIVVAEDSSHFHTWLTAQAQSAPIPSDSLHLTGQRLVTTGTCAFCHTIRGTDAKGKVAPDLTHVGSRLTIAAGTRPNTLGSIEAWITNAQSLKPGTLMPSLTQYNGRELVAMATYLESLK